MKRSNGTAIDGLLSVSAWNWSPATYSTSSADITMFHISNSTGASSWISVDSAESAGMKKGEVKEYVIGTQRWWMAFCCHCRKTPILLNEGREAVATNPVAVASLLCGDCAKARK